MLAEKYFPPGSGRYGRLATIAEKMDGFASLKPERWFGIWAMVLAGANVSAHVEDRWLYWENGSHRHLSPESGCYKSYVQPKRK